MRRVVAWTSRLPPGFRRQLKKIPGASAARDAMLGYPSAPPPLPGEPRAVVYLPTWATWDDMRQRPQYLVEAFADAGHRAYFVDPREPAPRTIGDVTVVPSIGSTPRSGVILYVHFAPNQTLFDRYDDPVVLYDILDDLSIYDDDEVGLPVDRTVRHHHADIVRDADVVIASSPVLIDEHRHEREDILLVENGVNITAFGAPVPRPADLPAGSGPIVGYHGMIARWFDFGLVADVAARLPDCTVVLVGPSDPSVSEEVGALVALPNVVHLGPRPSDAIAGYVQAFDAGIVPFVVDRLTRAVSPLKMYEYMAAGVPVVATPLPACEDDPFVSTAADGPGFAAAIERLVQPDAVQRVDLRDHAARHDWAHRIEPVLDRLDALGRRIVDQ